MVHSATRLPYNNKKRSRYAACRQKRVFRHTHAVIAIDFFATRASARPLKSSNEALVQYTPSKRHKNKLIPITTGTVRHPNGIQNSGRDQPILFCSTKCRLRKSLIHAMYHAKGATIACQARPQRPQRIPGNGSTRLTQGLTTPHLRKHNHHHLHVFCVRSRVQHHCCYL